MKFVYREKRENTIKVTLTLQERLIADGNDMMEASFSNPRGFIDVNSIDKIDEAPSGCYISLRKGDFTRKIGVRDDKEEIQNRITKTLTQKELI